VQINLLEENLYMNKIAIPKKKKKLIKKKKNNKKKKKKKLDNTNLILPLKEEQKIMKHIYKKQVTKHWTILPQQSL